MQGRSNRLGWLAGSLAVVAGIGFSIQIASAGAGSADSAPGPALGAAGAPSAAEVSRFPQSGTLYFPTTATKRHPSGCAVRSDQPHESRHNPGRVVAHAYTECDTPGDTPHVEAWLYREGVTVGYANGVNVGFQKVRASPNTQCGNQRWLYSIGAHHWARSHHGAVSQYYTGNAAYVHC